MKTFNRAALEASTQDFFAQKGSFPTKLARQFGKKKLSLREGDTAFTARQCATHFVQNTGDKFMAETKFEKAAWDLALKEILLKAKFKKSEIH